MADVCNLNLSLSLSLSLFADWDLTSGQIVYALASKARMTCEGCKAVILRMGRIASMLLLGRGKEVLSHRCGMLGAFLFVQGSLSSQWTGCNRKRFG